MNSPEAHPAVDAVPAGPDGLLARAGQWWRRLRSVALLVVVLFFAWAAWQVVSVVRDAAAIHVALGWAAGVAIAAALWWISRPLVEALRMPRVVSPPPVPANGTLTAQHLGREYRYLGRYVKNLRRNPELAAHGEELSVLAVELEGMHRNLAAREVAAASEELTKWTRARLEPLLRELDQKADRLIYGESLKVGLGTAVSPYGTLDAFVVLWRSFQLIGRLSVLYYGRPGALGSLLVMRDVALATATAAALQSVGDSLGGVVARSIGGIAGVVAGPAAQGVTNGLVMARIGYLARNRCKSFRRWDPTTQRSALKSALEATRRVSATLTTEILGPVATRLGQAADATKRGVTSAFEGAKEVGQKIAAGLRKMTE